MLLFLCKIEPAVGRLTFFIVSRLLTEPAELAFGFKTSLVTLQFPGEFISEEGTRRTQERLKHIIFAIKNHSSPDLGLDI